MKTENYYFYFTIIALLLTVMSASNLFAQDSIPVEKLPEFAESLFVHLDTTKITTGILRDKQLFPMVDMQKFTGDSLNDTISLVKWRQAYYEI